jgi:hypothetical protein
MNKQQFKSNVKAVLENRTSDKYTIYTNKLEEFATKKSFGLRLLELLEDENIENIVLQSYAQKGYMGYTCNGFNMLKRSRATQLKYITFKVYYKSAIAA